MQNYSSFSYGFAMTLLLLGDKEPSNPKYNKLKAQREDKPGSGTMEF